MDFCVDESCGKCSPCRIGTTQMLNILNKITQGKGTEDDLKQLETIGKAMSKACLCALGQTAPNPTMSTIKNFREEYLEHIHQHRCRAGKCKELVFYEIDPLKCIGCGACSRKCPGTCISVEDASRYPDKKRPPYRIDQRDCLKCGECMKTCKFGAIVKR
jgi:NADH-quinone oxidoreductase subunit F/NADP-reducing hydrogenase subunit HndC